jgi:hypothetical protein
MFLVEVSDHASGVSEICYRFPGIRAFFVAFSFNSVLKLSMEDTEICDLVNFVLLFTFHCDRIRRWRFVKAVVPVGSKIVDMEDRIELQIVR